MDVQREFKQNSTEREEEGKGERDRDFYICEEITKSVLLDCWIFVFFEGSRTFAPITIIGVVNREKAQGRDGADSRSNSRSSEIKKETFEKRTEPERDLGSR